MHAYRWLKYKRLILLKIVVQYSYHQIFVIFLIFGKNDQNFDECFHKRIQKMVLMHWICNTMHCPFGDRQPRAEDMVEIYLDF